MKLSKAIGIGVAATLINLLGFAHAPGILLLSFPIAYYLLIGYYLNSEPESVTVHRLTR